MIKNNINVDVLFVSYGGSHALMLKDIYSNLLKAGKSSKFLALTSSSLTLREDNLPYDRLESLPFDKKNLDLIFKNFNLDKKNDLYTALSLRELLDNVGPQEAKKLYEKYGRSVFCQKKLALKILNYYNPKVLITSNLIRLPRALYLACSEKNIKSIFIEDMFMEASHKFLKSSEFLKDIAHPNISLDYIIAFHQNAIMSINKNLSSNGIINSPDIVPLGNANIDSTVKEFNSVSKLSDLPLNYDFFASNDFLRSSATDLLLDYYKNSKRVLVIKPHPNEDIQYYKKKFSILENVMVVEKSTNLVSLYKYADVVFGTNTTVLLQANVSGKSCLCLNVENNQLIVNAFIKTGIAKNIRNIDQLSSAIHGNEGDSKIVEIEIGAPQRTSDFILDLLN